MRTKIANILKHVEDEWEIADVVDFILQRNRSLLNRTFFITDDGNIISAKQVRAYELTDAQLEEVVASQASKRQAVARELVGS